MGYIVASLHRYVEKNTTIPNRVRMQRRKLHELNSTPRAWQFKLREWIR